MTNPLYEALLEPHLESEKTFLLHDDGSKTSYCEFLELASRLAHQLRELGIKPDDRIVVQVSKRLETLGLYAASILTGTVYLPLNTSYTLNETEYFIKDALPSFILCEDSLVKDLELFATNIGAKILTLNNDGSGTLQNDLDFFPNKFNVTERTSDSLAALLYTSGTTGQSKGAMLTQQNLLSNATSLTEFWKITNQDILIHALPIYHTHGLFVAINTSLLAGNSIRFMQKFNIDLIIEALPISTLLMGVPTFYTRLLSDHRFNRETTKNMRLFISGSAPLLAETHNKFEQKTGHKILERYGMSETGMNSSNPYKGNRKAGTVGYPLPDIEIKITNLETAQELKQGEVGMIEVKGPNLFSGYWNMPEKTKEEFRANGFFITGDLGMFDSEGYLHIIGREKDLIISGGHNIYPKEVEDIINQYDGVLESAVYGVPDPDLGEVVVSAIVMKPEYTLVESDLQLFVKSKLANYKNPKVYNLLKELPRNTMGKVQKNILRQTKQLFPSTSPLKGRMNSDKQRKFM